MHGTQPSEIRIQAQIETRNKANNKLSTLAATHTVVVTTASDKATLKLTPGLWYSISALGLMTSGMTTPASPTVQVMPMKHFTQSTALPSPPTIVNASILNFGGVEALEVVLAPPVANNNEPMVSYSVIAMFK